MRNIIYLETTAVIDSVFKSNQQVLTILNESEKSITSQYVKMEIKKGFLNNLVLLHNKMVQCRRWSEVQDFITRLNLSPNKYYSGTILDAMAKFWKAHENKRPSELREKHGNIPVSEIIMRDAKNSLRISIRQLLKKVDKVAEEKINPMECFVDLEEPYLNGDLFINKPHKCPDSAKECKIKKFFHDNIQDFKLIYKGLSQLPKEKVDAETQRRISSIRDIIRTRLSRSTMKFSNKSQDEKLCWDCADAIHAVLAPKGTFVITKNARHFESICRFIERDCITY